MKPSEHEFAYIVVQYRSGIHRVQRIRSPHNGNIYNRVPTGSGMVASCKKRFIGEAYQTYEEAFYKMVELHDKYLREIGIRLMKLEFEFNNLGSRSNEIVREGKLLGYLK